MAKVREAYHAVDWYCMSCTAVSQKVRPGRTDAEVLGGRSNIPKDAWEVSRANIHEDSGGGVGGSR